MMENEELSIAEHFLRDTNTKSTYKLHLKLSSHFKSFQRLSPIHTNPLYLNESNIFSLRS